MKTVDILLPTYNGERFLEKQISSILTQSYLNFNLLIRDDGSTDNTKQIVNSYRIHDKRITLYEDNMGNLGLVSNIEYLLKRSKSDYIMYCDQDDVWLPSKIEKLLNEILISEEKFGTNTALLVHSDSYVTDQELNIKSRFKGIAPLNYGLNKSLFRFYVQGASTIFNSKLKQELLPFVKGIYIHDRYAHLIAEIVGKRMYLNEPLMLYRQHSANLVGSTNLITKIKNNVSLRNKFYLLEDKDLIHTLSNRFPDNNLLDIYVKLTNSNELNRLEKVILIIKHKISLRLKEWVLLVVNG